MWRRIFFRQIWSTSSILLLALLQLYSYVLLADSKLLGQVDLEPHFWGHIRSAASGVCVVRPTDSEYIEYATEDAECVILDVLTPPYFLDSWTDKRECKYFDCERGKDGNWLAKPIKFTKFSLVPTEAVAYEGIPAFGHDSVPSTEKFSRFGGR